MTTISTYPSSTSFNASNNNTLASIMTRNSRLSSLNPMRSSKQLPPPPITNPNSNQHLNINQSNAHKFPLVNQNGYSTHDETQNFALTRVDTCNSLDSQFSVQLHYQVTLNLNKKEIELVRYTWNKLLLEEPIEQKKSVLPQMPGQFHIDSDVGTKHGPGAAGGNAASKSLNFVKQTSSSTIASSLFCRQLYGNLLQMEPGLEKMFPSIKHQAVAFAGVMSLAISQLENISNIDDYLTKLGKRHSRILNIEAPQFELMGEALIQTFHERFGQRFNQDLEILWIKLYMYLSNSMIQYGMDPKLRLNRNDNTGLSKDHPFEHNRLDSEENFSINEPLSMLGSEDPATRTTSYSASAASTHGDISYFDTRKGSVGTQQTSIITNQPLMQNMLAGAESIIVGGKPAKKKKQRASLRTRTKEQCVIV